MILREISKLIRFSRIPDDEFVFLYELCERGEVGCNVLSAAFKYFELSVAYRLQNRRYISVLKLDDSQYLYSLTDLGQDEIVIAERKSRRYDVLRAVYYDSGCNPNKSISANAISKKAGMSPDAVFAEFQALEGMALIIKYRTDEGPQAMITGRGIEYFEKSESPFAVHIHGDYRIDSDNNTTNATHSPIMSRPGSSSPPAASADTQ